jgi:hypothetical protein
MFEVSSAKQKAGKEEPPSQASMRASSNEKIRRNPSTDQRKVRRMLNKKSMTKVAWSIADARQILEAKQYGKVDGMMLDTFSASALVQIFDALSPENQAKLEAMSLDKAMDIVWKLAAKHGSVYKASVTVRVEDIESDTVGIGSLNGERIRFTWTPEDAAWWRKCLYSSLPGVWRQLEIEQSDIITTAKRASLRTAQNYTMLTVRGVDNYEYDWGYEFDDDYANSEGEPAVIVYLYNRDGDVVDSIGGVTLASLNVSDHGNTNVSNEDEKYLYHMAQDLATNFYKSASRRTAGRPGDEAFDEYEKDDWDPRDGEPKYPELAEDDDDLFYDDFAHEASASPFAITDPTDTRPLHTRVAAAFLKG